MTNIERLKAIKESLKEVRPSVTITKADNGFTVYCYEADDYSGVFATLVEALAKVAVLMEQIYVSKPVEKEQEVVAL